MAKDEHLDQLHAAIRAHDISLWNRWREENPRLKPDLNDVNLWKRILRGANFSNTSFGNANLSRADLSGANLSNACLSGAYLVAARLESANLMDADLSTANLSGASLRRADLTRAYLNAAYLGEANLYGANLSEACLFGAYLGEAILAEANLTEANLTRAALLETILWRATLVGCRIYGVSSWGLDLREAKQSDLLISAPHEAEIRVDDLDAAQIIQILLYSEKGRKFIGNIAPNLVFILGRFTGERNAVLDAIRGELRTYDLMPVMFDVEPPSDSDLTGTVRILAQIARFIVVDLTDLASIPKELTAVIPDLPSVPVQAVRLVSQGECEIFEQWRKYPWVLPLFGFDDPSHLLASLREKVIHPPCSRMVASVPGRRLS